MVLAENSSASGMNAEEKKTYSIPVKAPLSMLPPSQYTHKSLGTKFPYIISK